MPHRKMRCLLQFAPDKLALPSTLSKLRNSKLFINLFAFVSAQTFNENYNYFLFVCSVQTRVPRDEMHMYASPTPCDMIPCLMGNIFGIKRDDSSINWVYNAWLEFSACRASSSACVVRFAENYYVLRNIPVEFICYIDGCRGETGRQPTRIYYTSCKGISP